MASDRVDRIAVSVWSDELIEVQRAELVMNLDKPKKDTFIGLECQSDAVCSFCNWNAKDAVSVSVLEGEISHHWHGSFLTLRYHILSAYISGWIYLCNDKLVVGPTVSGRIVVLLEPGAEMHAQKVTRLAAHSLSPQKVFHSCCKGCFTLDAIHMVGLGLTWSTTENSTDKLPNSFTPKPSGWLKQLHGHWGLEALTPATCCKMANL